MQRFRDTLSLIRVQNCLLAMAGVWVGAWMTWLQGIYFAPLVTGLAVFAVCAAGNVVNDLLDEDIDRVNHPERVIVRGSLSRRFAAALAVGLHVLAFALALVVNLAVTATVLVATVLLFGYNLYLRRIPVAGNLAVAVLAGLTFIAGGLSVDWVLTWELPGPLVPAVFAVLFHLVREIIKDARDTEGDRLAGSGSLPLAIGIRPAVTVALAVFAVLVFLTLVPVFAGWFGQWYKVIAVYVVDLPILALLIFVWGNPSPTMLSIGSSALKAGMVLGVVALLLA